MVGVIVGEHESLDRALYRFKRKCAKAGVLREYKQARYFIKPSERRRLQRLKAMRRAHKMNRLQA
ncbi:MAG TPA: 30S ribosomal protein S21 [Bacteroidetes bacterium]|nr:30S ribosomal protein S21 [Bacteroidota bacterium]